MKLALSLTQRSQSSLAAMQTQIRENRLALFALDGWHLDPRVGSFGEAGANKLRGFGDLRDGARGRARGKGREISVSGAAGVVSSCRAR